MQVVDRPHLLEGSAGRAGLRAATIRTSPWASCGSTRCHWAREMPDFAPETVVPALDLGGAAGMPRLLFPAGTDVAEGDHTAILPCFASGSQGATVSISASGGIRVFFTTTSTLEPCCGGLQTFLWASCI